MTKFIDPSWRSECNFNVSFEGQDRLAISGRFPPVSASSNSDKDIMLVPHSCDKSTCVFHHMGIISDADMIDVDAYMKMLDNFTDINPAWVTAKAWILDKCMDNVGRYHYRCEINNMLACTLDTFTSFCHNRTNICTHDKRDVLCQVSSSYFKNRREICILPELIHRSHLQECGLETLYKVDLVPVKPYRSKIAWYGNSHTCSEQPQPTTCLLKKMGVVDKYCIMDFLKMKDRIRQFTSDQVEWTALLDIYLGALNSMPLYEGYNLTEKRLLNALDAMLMTCPVSKRKNSVECNKIFRDITHTPPKNQNLTKKKLDDIMKHYAHVFSMPSQPETANLHKNFKHLHPRIVKKPAYDFAFLNSKEAPPVRIINLKTEGGTRRPIDLPLIVPTVSLRPETHEDVLSSAGLSKRGARSKFYRAPELPDRVSPKKYSAKFVRK